MQHQTGLMFGETLVQNKLITEDKIVAVLVAQFGIPYSSLELQDPKELLEIFEPQMMRKFQFVPMDSIGNVLVIAIAGLLSEDVFKEIETQTGCSLQVYLTKMSEIDLV